MQTMDEQPARDTQVNSAEIATKVPVKTTKGPADKVSPDHADMSARDNCGGGKASGIKGFTSGSLIGGMC